MAEQSTQIVREAPEIEAYKLALLQSAKALADQGQTIPPYMVAEMSGLQIKATELAEAGIGGYQPYLQEAGYTLGDAQTAMGGVMTDAKPFQDEAATFMRTGAANVPEQVTAAQTGIAGAIDYGQTATQTATAGLGQAATGARAAAAGGQEALGAAGANIPGVIGDVTTGTAAAKYLAHRGLSVALVGPTEGQHGALGACYDEGRIYRVLDPIDTYQRL